MEYSARGKHDRAERGFEIEVVMFVNLICSSDRKDADDSSKSERDHRNWHSVVKHHEEYCSLRNPASKENYN